MEDREMAPSSEAIFSHPQTKELVDLGFTVIPISWYQIWIPLGPCCRSKESTSLFGQKSLCTHACNRSYMKGNPSDLEYEKPSYDTITMLVIWHLHLQFCSVREGLTVYLAKVLSDINSRSHRYTYTDTQIL